VTRIGLTDVRSWVHLRAHTVQASRQRRGALMHRSASAVFVLGRDTNTSMNWSYRHWESFNPCGSTFQPSDDALRTSQPQKQLVKIQSTTPYQ